MLLSRGVPRDLPHLQTEWHRVTRNGASALPEYVSIRFPEMTLGFVDGRWVIKDVLPLAWSDADALHPNTIHAGEWHAYTNLVVTNGVGELVSKRLPAFCIEAASYKSSPESPIRLEDIGMDYFTRKQKAPPVFFVDPLTKRVYCSKAKGVQGIRSPKLASAAGKRWCDRCRLLLSANNFVSQHLRTHR